MGGGHLSILGRSGVYFQSTPLPALPPGTASRLREPLHGWTPGSYPAVIT